MTGYVPDYAQPYQGSSVTYPFIGGPKHGDYMAVQTDSRVLSVTSPQAFRWRDPGLTSPDEFRVTQTTYTMVRWRIGDFCEVRVWLHESLDPKSDSAWITEFILVALSKAVWEVHSDNRRRNHVILRDHGTLLDPRLPTARPVPRMR